MFKKIYVEITNNCNLNCDFCIKNKRKSKFMNKDEFNIVLSKIKPFTKYLYFHILGEPLLHPLINDFIDLASKDFFINITSNGYLIKRVSDQKNIHRINISLHSFDEKYHISLEDYLSDIFDSVDQLKNNTIISYRLWTNSIYSKKIIKALEKKYLVKIDSNKVKLQDNVYFEVDKEFVWPSFENNIYSEKGRCMGTISHIGILVDGTIVPCCLDALGIINLGNIFNDSLENIINGKLFNEIKSGFQDNKKIHPLCKKCNFYEYRK